MLDILNALALFANFILIPSVTYSCQLALGALAVTLIYGVLRFANFAHGEMSALGTAFVILFTWFFQAQGVSLGVLPTALIALPFGVALSICYALLVDRYVYRHYRRQKAKPVTFLIVAIGVMFATNGVVRFILGTKDISFADGARFVVRAREVKEFTGLAEGFSLKVTQSLTIVITFALVGALFWFLTYTRTGKSMRAFSDNEDLALLSGINPERVVMLIWIIVATLITIGGTLYGLDKSYKPYVYFQLLLPTFAAAIVGGLGSPLGAVAGGFLIAFSEIMVTFAYKKLFNYFLPDTLHFEGLVQFIGTEYKIVVSFIILVLVLLFRPHGIFKGQVV